ncbi:MAG: hypothetical protein JW820_01505 [Spirochaetales bacterium]|nr:hypothetical protein [Spirochaetales bacterium]
MKRPALLSVMILLCLMVAAAAFAQDTEEPQVFVKTLPIMKVLAHPLGYRVLYVKSSMEVADFYVPFSWFKPGGKGEVVFGSGEAYPFFSVFYVNGEFDHVKLYLIERMGHVSWGSMRRREGDSSKFDVETLDLQY